MARSTHADGASMLEEGHEFWWSIDMPMWAFLALAGPITIFETMRCQCQSNIRTTANTVCEKYHSQETTPEAQFPQGAGAPTFWRRWVFAIMNHRFPQAQA